VEEPEEPEEEVETFPTQADKENRSKNAEEWCKAAVQEKIDSKLRREREAVEKIEREKREAEAIVAEAARIKAEHEAKLALEAGVKEEADRRIAELKQAKIDDLGTVSWPLRPKPMYLSYAKNAEWDERFFVARAFNAMEDGGLFRRVWIDKDEGVVGSPHAIVDRYDALAAAQFAIVVLSPTFMADPDGHLELKEMRARTVGGCGSPLKVVVVVYESVEECMSDDLRTILDLAATGAVSVIDATDFPPPTEEGPYRPPPTTQSERELALARLAGEQVADVLRPLSGEGPVELVQYIDGRTEPDHRPNTPGREVRMWLHSQSGTWRGKRTVEWNLYDVTAWLETNGKAMAHLGPLLRHHGIDGFLLIGMSAKRLGALETDTPVPAPTCQRFQEVLERRLHSDKDKPFGPAINNLALKELQTFVLELFVAYDEDKSGGLDRREFRKCLKHHYLNLTAPEIQMIMAEADENEDGVISYKEFVDLMVKLVASAKAKTREKHIKRQRTRFFELTSADMIKGMPQGELEALVERIFKESDEDGNGQLDRKEFKKCLYRGELGLNRREMNAFLSQADTDGDGLVSYAEFVPMCFQILKARMEEDVMGELQEMGKVHTILMNKIEPLDLEGDGRVPQSDLREAIKELSVELLGLNNIQILLIMAETKPDKRGRCDYRLFVKAATDIIWGLFDIASQMERQKAVKALAADEGDTYLKNVRGIPLHHVRAIMDAAFRQSDRDGNGVLDTAELQEVLQRLGASQLALSDYEVNALMSAIDADGDGVVNYSELLHFMIDVLAQLDREQKVADRLSGDGRHSTMS